MITGSVNGQTLTVMTPLVAADSVNYITCAFAFSDDWDDLDKYVHFAKGEASYSALIADDGTVGETAHINLPAGVWDMYVHGQAVVDDYIIKRVTTNIFKLRVSRTGMTDGDPFPEITPSIGEQIIAQATAQADRAEGFADSAEADAERAEAAIAHNPIIGDNENWFVWNPETEEYEDSGISSHGQQGLPGQPGAPGAPGIPGEPGSPGADGDDGVGITSIVFDHAGAQGGNVYLITLTDGSTYTFTAAKGSTGAQGIQGERGLQGIQGIQGIPGVPGTDGQDGVDGADGVGIASIAFDHADSSGNNIYNVNLSDGTSYQITAPRGASGTGTGDMLASDYDSTSVVRTAGGIVAYVRGQIPSVPTALSELSADATHRLVTDSEKSTWNGKQDAISDLSTIRSGAAAGATAVQPETGKGLFSGSYNDLSDKPTIPSTVTESTVAGWGFTKNTGTYSKPSTGIPKTDLASAVQTSLSKADSALQSYTETDPVFLASAAHGISSSDISNWNAKQTALVSGTNIKTINSQSILGSGNLTVTGLPAVTASDNGKFLRVVNGAWAAATIPVMEGGTY